MTLLDFARSLRKRFDKHQPLVQVSISRENLFHNLNAYRSAYPKLRFAPVLKSNAYGHGLDLVAKLLDGQDVPFLAVDSFYEARRLRYIGIKSRVLVIGYVLPEDILSSTLRNVDFGIVDIEQLRTISTTLTQATRIHLKIDTGMHRQGLMPADLDEAIRLCKLNPHITIVGICTHLADSDSSDEAFTQKQVSVWRDASKRLLAEFPSIEFRHISASAGARFSDDADSNVVRLGISLYGIAMPTESSLGLKPVLEMRTVISSMREIPAGESVGYNATFTASHTTKVATVPAGYFEGVDRGLSGIGSLLVAGKVARIVGRVSMNMTGIDVTDIPEAKVGNPVIVISRNPQDENSVSRIADLCKTIPYTILVHIPQHLKRVVE